ncbi:MAG: helix-turn-helix transcriptional regulator [Candidatus Omnitrophica bacterium]|nr:helix-turn-helix transcriptional regulator [Candidatus Omnitrophota bacterium]
MKKTIFSEEYKSLVKRLRQARKEAGFGQTEAARKLGVTQSYISKIEAGQLRLDVIQLKEIARVYHKKVSYFIP